MLEKDLNGIVSRSFNNQGGWGFKISDSGQYVNGYATHSKNPADGIAFYDRSFVMWESKWLPKPMALSLNRLEDHQIESLIRTLEYVDGSHALFLVGVNFGRGDVRVYVWKDHDLYDIRKRRDEKRNILKKEFEARTNYVKVLRSEIDLKQLFSLPLDEYGKQPQSI